MLKNLEQAAYFAALVGLAAFLLLTAWRGSSVAPPSNNGNSQDQPAQTHQTSKPEMTKHRQEQRSYWASAKQHVKENWSEFVESMEKNDKAVVAISTMFIALFTIVLAIATGALFWSSEKVAEAAKGSTEIAERALVAGQRAFVSVSYQHSAGREFATKKLTQWIFTPIWTNAGNTPTRNMVNHINISALDKEIDDSFDFPDQWSAGTPAEKRRPVPLGIAPKAWIQGQSVAVSVEDIEAVISGKKFLYFWGWAAYDDVFPGTAKHVTRFANRIMVGGDASNPTEISFSYPLLWKYNCSDEECSRQGVPADWIPRIFEVPQTAPAVIDPQPEK